MCYAFTTAKQPHIKCLRVKIFRDCRGYTAAALYMDFFVVEEEYIDGISLQEMIDGGKEMSEARDIVSSICGTGAVRTDKVRCMNRYLCGWHFAEHLAYGCASGGGAVPQRRPSENYRKMHGDESGFQIPKRFRTSHRFGARGSFRPEDKASSHL